MVSTLDFESSDPSSNLGGTCNLSKILLFYFSIFFRFFTEEDRKNYQNWIEELATKNNNLFSKFRAVITKDFQVLPYLVHLKTLNKKLVQPDWIMKEDFKHLTLEGKEPNQNLREKIFRLFCGHGKILSGNLPPITLEHPKSVMIHHGDFFLKLGPFQAEVISYHPYRTKFHNVSTQ